MKLASHLSALELAPEVDRLVAEYSPRFVAIVFNSDGQHVGSAATSYLAICSALDSKDKANDLCADLAENSSPYLYDEDYKRDTWYGYSNRTRERLCVLIRC